MDSSCIPPKGSTYLTIGQDLFSIDEYVNSQYNASLHAGSSTPISKFVPSAAMVYTDLESLSGLDRPIDYGSGVEYADGILESLFPGSGMGLQIGLWLNGTYGCTSIVGGKRDDKINELIHYLKSCVATQIFLRLGYEFDNPSFGYSSSPETYVEAFRYIVNEVRRQMTSKQLLKIKFVWHSWGSQIENGLSLNDFYPGNEYVDWIGISIFQQVYPWQSQITDGPNEWRGNLNDVRNVLNFATMRNKPTMIAESTPFGGINLNSSNAQTHNVTDMWNAWFQNVIDLIEKYDISMWCYINCNWDSQPMWHNVGFGDTRLSINADIMRKWRDVVLNGKNQKFLMAGSLQNCDLGRKHGADIKLQQFDFFFGGCAIFIVSFCLGLVAFNALIGYKAPKSHETNVLLPKSSDTTTLG